MYKDILLLSIIAIYLFPSRVATQEACSSLLQQGIYDHYSLTTGSSNYAEYVSNFCSKYAVYLQNHASSTSDSSDSDGFLFFGSDSTQSTTLTADQINALGSVLCVSGANSGSGQANTTQLASFVDPTAMATYEDCLSQYAAGLQVSTTVRQSDQGQVTIQITYVAPTGSSPKTQLTGIVISPSSSWNCTGPLVQLLQANGSHTIGTDAVAMSCGRKISSVPFIYQNQSLYARASTITIMLNSGTVTRSFIPIYANPPQDMSMVDNSAIIQRAYLESPLSIVYASINDTMNNLTAFIQEFEGFSTTLEDLSTQLTADDSIDNSDEKIWSENLAYLGQILPTVQAQFSSLGSSIDSFIQAWDLNATVLDSSINAYFNQTVAN